MEMVVHSQGATLFNEEELRGIAKIERGLNHIQVECIIKTKVHGEPAGKLKILQNGKLEIKCECASNCPKDKLSPWDFLKHNERKRISEWKKQICVITEKNERVPLQNTRLLKYYYKENPEEVQTLRPMKAVHRDEFIRCSQCGKERRFRLRTAAECRAFHDALAKVNWTCSDNPCKLKTCDDPEERQSRKIRRGCPISDSCPGCMSCACVGCVKCRFKGCLCRTCVDFMENIWQ